MTDRALLDIDQNARESHPITDLPRGWEQIRVWEAETEASGHLRDSLAFFNLSDAPVHLHARWAELGLSSDRHAARDLTNHRQLAPSDDVEMVLPEHGSAVYRVQ